MRGNAISHIREREREIYTGRRCIVPQRGIVGRVPWSKAYTKPLPFISRHKFSTIGGSLMAVFCEELNIDGENARSDALVCQLCPLLSLSLT